MYSYSKILTTDSPTTYNKELCRLVRGCMKQIDAFVVLDLVLDLDVLDNDAINLLSPRSASPSPLPSA